MVMFWSESGLSGSDNISKYFPHSKIGSNVLLAGSNMDSPKRGSFGMNPKKHPDYDPVALSKEMITQMAEAFGRYDDRRDERSNI